MLLYVFNNIMYNVYYSYNQIKFNNQSIKNLKQTQKKWPTE